MYPTSVPLLFFSTILNLFLLLPSPTLSLSTSSSTSVSNLLSTRHHTTHYSPTLSSPSSSPSHLPNILGSLNKSLRSPSSFNAQPWRFYVISTQEEKALFSQFFAGTNSQRVLNSTATIIFLSDLHPLNSSPLPKIYTGRNPSKARLLIRLFSSSPLPNIPLLTRFLSPIISFPIRLAINTYNTLLSLTYSVLQIFLGSFLLKKQLPNVLILPTLRNSRLWAVKNCMLLVQSFVLLCQESGFGTSIMEGYNSPLLLLNLPIKNPSHYEIPCVVSVGIPPPNPCLNSDDDVSQSHGTGRRKSPRLDLKSVLINYDSFPFSASKL